MDQDEMNNLYRGPSIDASYQVLVHLAEEKIKMWNVNGRQVMAKAHIAFGKVMNQSILNWIFWGEIH